MWGDLTLRGTGSLAATGSQCGIYVSGKLAVEGCKVDARADGAGISDARAAGVIADCLAVRGGGRFVAAGAGSGAGVRAYGVYLQVGAAGGGAAGCSFSVDASWLDVAGVDGGVACTGGSLMSARFVMPAGGTFGASGVVDADGSVAAHVTIEPVDATASAGEPGGCDVPDGAGDPAGDAGPTVEQPSAGSVTDPVLKAATATPKTTATTKTTVTKTTASTPFKANTASAATVTLPKTADINWIAASLALFLLGTALLGRCLLPLS